jgi:hypothetical protein
MESGRWTIDGLWLERNVKPIVVKGGLIIAWSQENWFTMVSKLVFPQSDRPEISCQYRGRLDGEERQYTYVLQQSLLGQVEGEGWINAQTIIQNYWVLGDRQRQSGFETFYRINDQTYHLSGGILIGHYLVSTMEAKLERHF